MNKTARMALMALRAGHELTHSVWWKNTGAVVSLILPLLWFLSKIAVAQGWAPAEFTDEDLEKIGEWILTGWGILSAYLFQATSRRVGISRGEEISEPIPEYEYSPPEPIGGILLRPDGLRQNRAVQAGSRTDTRRSAGEDPSLGDFNRFSGG